MLLQLFFFFAFCYFVQAFDVNQIITEIQNHTELQSCLPTLRMLDASGKFPSGLLSGNYVDLGNFDQCINTEVNVNETSITGKYCVMKTSLPLDKITPEFITKSTGIDFMQLSNTDFTLNTKQKFKFHMKGLNRTNKHPGLILGWCLPSTCPVDELTEFLSNFTEKILPEIRISTFSDGICQTKEDLKNEYSPANITIIIFLCATLLIMVLSTVNDMYLHKNKKKPAHIILIAFSVKTNGQKLLTISNSPDQLSCLNGIRFISMMWVLLGHRFSVSFTGPSVNLISLDDWANNSLNMYILNATISVDSFFVLSGLLISYGFCLAKDKGIKFNIINFYVHRYLRLTPVLAVLVWIHATILDFFGSGPFWPLMSTFKNHCSDYWWSSLLYIQNYYNNKDICIGQSWYLSVDMQLFLLSPLILIPLWKWPKYTFYTSLVLIFVSIVDSFAISYIDDIPAFATINKTNKQKYNSNYYITTHTRYGPWLMGLLLGYYLFKLKKNKLNLNAMQIILGWAVGLGLLLSTVFAGHDLMLNPNNLGNAFFNGLHRHGWALGLCWLILACTQGYGGPINAILSWSVFQILGRLTYTIYLVHLTILYLMAGASKTSTYFSNFDTLYVFWGDFMISLVMSLCLTLAYESPMVVIEKVLFQTRKPAKPELPPRNPTVSPTGQNNKGYLEE